jgi:hypothetical protein
MSKFDLTPPFSCATLSRTILFCILLGIRTMQSVAVFLPPCGRVQHAQGRVLAFF